MRKLSGDNPELTVKLSEIFGQPIEDEALRSSIGQKILDIIRERSESGVGLDGRFPGYSKAYKESLDYQAFGKDGTVNLRLTGDMLELMDIVDESEDQIKIGWDDPNEAAKAHGHITGSVGKKRDFFGLRPSEINEIKKEFQSEIERGGTDERNESLLDILRRFEDG